MTTGLLALLDDVAALVKVSAASLDDIGAQVAKTGGKVSGIVIDDAAVTPKYVVGLDPKRELTIIWNIARRSLFNKLVILGPAALLLGTLAPWAITPILMLGGAYLCFEGYEKVHHMLFPHPGPLPQAGEGEVITPEALEKLRVASAVRTDMILSAEIMAITYATVAERDVVHQILVLAAIAVSITIAVYGFVALIVKADDVGVHLAKTGRSAAMRAFGRGLVKAMPGFLKILGLIGTAAMLWVGGEIVAHGIPLAHHALEHLAQMLAAMPVLAWLAKAGACALGGLLLGAAVAQGVGLVSSPNKKPRK
jgi:predicted DNA repair protein MutK